MQLTKQMTAKLLKRNKNLRVGQVLLDFTGTQYEIIDLEGKCFEVRCLPVDEMVKPDLTVMRCNLSGW